MSEPCLLAASSGGPTFEVVTRLLPWPVLIGLLVLAAAAAVALYRRDLRLVPPAVGRVLLALRVWLVVLLLALLADPALIRRRQVVDPGEVLIAVDASRSFGFRGEPGGPTRRELAVEALAAGLGRDLAGRFRLAWLAVAEEAKPHAAPRDWSASVLAAALPPATGGRTDLGQPLAREVFRRGAETIAGVLLLTDGNHNAGGDPLDAARALGTAGVPLVAVGFGPEARPPDRALAAVEAEGRVFAGDEVRAQVTLSHAGLTAAELRLSVREGETILKEVIAAVPAGEGMTRVPVAFPAGGAGRKKLTFAIPAESGEAAAENNARDLWLEVRSGKARVLFIDGRPRWEERYLRASLARDSNVELGAFLATPPPDRRLPAGTPRARDDLFAHDVIVLGDLEPTLFGREEIESLRDFALHRGGALVLIAGPRSMPYRWDETPLAELIPVHLLSPAPPPSLGITIAREGLPLALTEAGRISDIARLVPGRERNFELWELLPRPLWWNPIAGVKPGAAVLATAGREALGRLPGGQAVASHPGAAGSPAADRFLAERGAVFVAAPAGAGKVFYSGIDATWRWRFRLGDELHKRFWGQVIRWAIAERLEAEDAHARLGTDAVLYDAGAPVTVNAAVRKSPAEPHEGPVEAVITRLADGASGRVSLSPIPKSGGRYRGTADLAAIGLGPRRDGDLAVPAAEAPAEHVVRLEIPGIPGYAERPDRAAASFAVRPPPDLERDALSINVAFLTELCARAGGKYLPAARAAEAATAFPEKSRVVEQAEEWRAWDHPGLLAVLLLGALAAEWVLRKRRDLV